MCPSSEDPIGGQDFSQRETEATNDVAATHEVSTHQLIGDTLIPEL